MLLMKRFGAPAKSSSSRVHETVVASSASTLPVTNRRPVVVAAHAELVLAFVRSIAATAPPARVPQDAAVRRSGPSSTQSPHTSSKVPKKELQMRLASSKVRLPRPAVLVRYTVRPVPANIVLDTTGSLMTGE